MGYIRHHAIVITSWSEGRIKIAHGVAEGIFGEQVSNIVIASINGYFSFFVGPDGSKEGWPDSNNGDERRSEFIDWLKLDGCCDYVELFYGDDDGDADIVNHN